MLSSHPYFCVARGGAPSVCPPGHTMMSLRKGIEVGAEMLAVEVRVTRDEVLVVWPSDQKIVAEEPIHLTNHTIAEWRELTEGTDAPIVTLDELLELAAATRCGLMLDLHAPGAEKNLVRRMRTFGIPYQALVLTSSNPTSLATMHSLDKRIPSAHAFKMDHLAKVTPELIGGLDSEAVIWPSSLLTPEVVTQLKGEGLTVYASVVNLAAEMRRMRNDSDVDGIVTDFPELLLSIHKTSQLARRAA